MFNPIIIPLIIGFVADALLGDPRWIPHPVRAFGYLISKTDQLLNKGKYRLLKGALSALVLIGLTFLLFSFIQYITLPYPFLYLLIASFIVFLGLANRGLIAEALKVEQKLQTEGLEAARQQLSFIVGRDTAKLNENQVRTAVLETLAENLSDGVVAPLFFYAIGGFPLMMTYKMVNTLDSMIAYKNEKYIYFGRFAARIDDFANFIPARITAFLMAIVGLNLRGFSFIFKYGHKHCSPNSGHPEAALAGIFNCRFGGSNYYQGKLVEKPFIGENSRLLTPSDINKAITINALVAILAVLIIVIFNLKS